MAKKRLLVLSLLLMAVISYTASAALIHGSVYDLGLDEVSGTVVEINTQPRQQMVAKNSTYFFNVPLGDYTITAKQKDGTEVVASAEENITVSEQGEFILDIILFPSFAEEEQILADSDFDIETGFPEEDTNYFAVAALLIAVAAFFLILRLGGKDIMQRKKEIEEEEKQDIKKVVEFLKKEGGRATQKDIRKNFPQSEAKISLIITELESAGRIKKIKKGRGNIIILNK